MDPDFHSLATLFEQLGLPDSDEEIQDFISQHKGLKGNTCLHDAPFWNSAQAEFLKQARETDSDWTIIVDELNTLLRS